MASQSSVLVDFSSFRNVIDGNLGSSKTLSQGVNPSNRGKSWDVPVATAEDLDDAVKAAQQSFRSWSRVPWESRQKLISNLRDLLLQYQQELAKIIMLEGGKPVRFWVSLVMLIEKGC
jgi:acyl-CoA reductase-like NAD-dependent aldehyde dehydrogenase